MKAKVILINPPVPGDQLISSDNYFPYGLLSISTVLKENKIDVRIVDINNYFYSREFNEELLNDYIITEVCYYIKSYRPDIIGISSLFSGVFKYVKVTANEIKKRFPEIPIVIGGIHPTIFYMEILSRYDAIDYVVMGEGERSFLKLIKCLIDGNGSLETIDGVAFRDKGTIKVNRKKEFITDLDELAFIDYGILNIKEYYNMNTSNWYSPRGIEAGQPFPIISSRSCPNRCSFCSMWLVHGPKIRCRSAENVLDEMEYLYREYNVRYFQFMDDNMTFYKKRTLEICNGIVKRSMNIQFDTPNGVAINRLDEEIIDAMVEAGLVRISVGIETGSEYIRNKVMIKGLKNEKIYEIVESCARHKHLFIMGFFIIGMPEETHKTLEETYEMIKTLPLDAFSASFATPYPGTELFNYCMKNGLLPFKVGDFVDFENLHGNIECPFFEPHKLTRKDLVTFREKCFDFLKDKRSAANLPTTRSTVPLRYMQHDPKGASNLLRKMGWRRNKVGWIEDKRNSV